MKKLEKALAAEKERNKNLAAANRRLKYKNNMLQEELQFAKDVFLKHVRGKDAK